MSKPTASDLLDGRPIDRFDVEESRWGFRETHVYKWEGEHWMVHVNITSGDEGGIEAESEPCKVHKVPVESYKWEPVK